uniref:Acid phosphatase n=1 Tax=Ignisphaera aggregans TaxID=334771 RepID=A0A7C4FGY5_9CREN
MSLSPLSCISTNFVVVNCGKLKHSNNVVFDIDGVLIDCSERLAKCKEEARGNRRLFWNCFLSTKYMHLDKPIDFGFEVLRDRLSKSFSVVIITGRTDNMAQKTLEQLKSMGVEELPIVFRRRGNTTKDYIYKPSTAKKLRLEVLEVHEDDFEVLKSFKEAYPEARTYLYIFTDITARIDSE